MLDRAARTDPRRMNLGRRALALVRSNGYDWRMRWRSNDARFAINSRRPTRMVRSLQRAPRTASPFVELSLGSAISQSGRDEFPHSFRAEKRKLFHRGHNPLTYVDGANCYWSYSNNPIRNLDSLGLCKRVA